MAEQLPDISLWVWLLAAVGLLIRLKVFSPQPLRTAPARASSLSLQIFAGVFLLYIGASVLTQVAANAFSSPILHRASAPGLPLPTPTTLPSPALPPIRVAPTSRPASPTTSLPAATEPAATTAPATSQPVVIAQDFSADIQEQFVVALGELIPCLLILFLARRLVVGGLDGFGLSLRKLPGGLRDGLLGLIITYPLLIVLGSLAAFLFEHFIHQPQEVHPTLQMLSQHPNPLQQFLLVLFAGIIAPVLEEIAFRGLFQSVLAQRRWGLILPNSLDASYRASPAHRWGAIAITALIFASVHGLPEHIPVLFTLALALGYLYERTGNLWASITLHASFNLLNIYFVIRSNG